MAGGDGQDGPTFPGNSRSCAIWCILRCLALVRPLVKRWWASSMVTNAVIWLHKSHQYKLYEKWNWRNQDKVALVGTPAWLPCNVCDRRKWKWLTTEDEMHCKKSNWIKRQFQVSYRKLMGIPKFQMCRKSKKVWKCSLDPQSLATLCKIARFCCVLTLLTL